MQKRNPHTHVFANSSNPNPNLPCIPQPGHSTLSLLDEVRAGHILTKPKAKAIGNMLRLVRTIRQNGYVRRYSEGQRPLLPIPPTTGYSHHERIGEAQFLYTVFNQLMGTDVEVIYAFPDGKTNPNPVPKKLYEPRLFFLPTPRGIPMPKPSTPSGTYCTRNTKTATQTSRVWE